MGAGVGHRCCDSKHTAATDCLLARQVRLVLIICSGLQGQMTRCGGWAYTIVVVVMFVLNAGPKDLVVQLTIHPIVLKTILIYTAQTYSDSIRNRYLSRYFSRYWVTRFVKRRYSLLPVTAKYSLLLIESLLLAHIIYSSSMLAHL